MALTSENVTVLFTDMVGSTALSASLAPDAADELRRAHFSVLRHAVAQAGGVEVKSLGDGLMAVFATASNALSCAVVMQQSVERNNRQHTLAVALRVGISAGEVTREDDDYFGDPVIEAARFCALCRGGQILAADVVRLMAGRRTRHECRSRGKLALKGLPDTVEAVEVLWEPLAGPTSGTAIPLPTPLAVRPLAGLVGRDRELAAIDDAFNRVLNGGVEVLLVSGEAGVGKTSLVAGAAQRVAGVGACVLFGHCEEGLVRPYQLFREALQHYAAHAPQELLQTQVMDHGGALGRLVPDLGASVLDPAPVLVTDADTDRYLLFGAVVGLLVAASDDAPVVLVFEDLQWADAASLALLRHLIGTAERVRLLFLGTYRDDELPGAHDLRETIGILRRRDILDRIDLAGLDDRSVVGLMQAAAGHELDGAGVDLARALHRETDGNAFFLTEILRHLVETNAIGQDPAGRWTTVTSLDDLVLPESLREVIGGRVARLGESAERALSIAAVIGREFDLELLAAASHLDEEVVLDLLEDAAAAALVREAGSRPGEFSFAHSLIQRTLYNDLGATRRARTHRQVARSLEQLGDSDPGSRVGELARHWTLGMQPTDLKKAIHYVREAGEAALRALAPGDARLYFGQALDLCNQDADVDPALVTDLTIRLGIAQRQTGDPAFRDTLLKAAHEAAARNDHERLVMAALENNRGFYTAVGATDTAKVEVLENALAVLSPANVHRPLVLAALCSELAHGSSLERRRELADQAVAAADDLGDDSIMVRVLNHVYVPLQVPQLLDVALARTEEAFARASRRSDPALLYWAAMWRLETAARAADIETMDRCMQIHASTAEQLNQPIFMWGRTFVRALRELISGDTDAAERFATDALAIGTEGGQPDASTIFGAQLMVVSGQRGNMSDLIPLIEKLAAETPDISPWLFGSLLAKAHVEADRTGEALRHLDAFAAAGFDLALDQVWLTGMVDYAEAAIGCRSRAHAEPLYRRLLPWAHQVPATGASALPPVSQYLGGLATVLDDYESADNHFAHAGQMSHRMHATFFCASNDLLWGRMYLARGQSGDPERARVLLQSAKSVAASHGYANVERRATTLLQTIEG